MTGGISLKASTGDASGFIRLDVLAQIVDAAPPKCLDFAGEERWRLRCPAAEVSNPSRKLDGVPKPGYSSLVS